jgi:hypothetical protein
MYTYRGHSFPKLDTGQKQNQEYLSAKFEEKEFIADRTNIPKPSSALRT